MPQIKLPEGTLIGGVHGVLQSTASRRATVEDVLCLLRYLVPPIHTPALSVASPR